MTEMQRQLTKEEALLNDPRTRGPILTSIGREFIIEFFRRMNFIAIAEEAPMLPPEGTIWRQIKFKPTPADKDLAIKKFVDDILEQQITHFYKLPNIMDLTAVLEGNGIVVRVTCELFPKIMLVLDVMGHK